MQQTRCAGGPTGFGRGGSDHIALPDATDSATATTRGVAVGKPCRSASAQPMIGPLHVPPGQEHTWWLAACRQPTRDSFSSRGRSTTSSEVLGSASGHGVGEWGCSMGHGSSPDVQCRSASVGSHVVRISYLVHTPPSEAWPSTSTEKMAGILLLFCFLAQLHLPRSFHSDTDALSSARARSTTVQTDPGSAPIKAHYVLFRCPRSSRCGHAHLVTSHGAAAKPQRQSSCTHRSKVQGSRCTVSVRELTDHCCASADDAPSWGYTVFCP